MLRGTLFADYIIYWHHFNGSDGVTMPRSRYARLGDLPLLPVAFVFLSKVDGKNFANLNAVEHPTKKEERWQAA